MISRLSPGCGWSRETSTLFTRVASLLYNLPMDTTQPASPRARKTYVERINRVIDYIDTHLAEELALEELANVAAFS
ncbi:MAG TPA: hypothetical protein ENN69_03950, partial [Spirochaetia bacterium]|nr:hypothetical protein [Spirochaetia bacterium]